MKLGLMFAAWLTWAALISPLPLNAQSSPIPQGRSIAPQYLPTTVEIKKPDGQIVGTATRWRNSIVYRDANGEISGSSIMDAEGKQTHYDPHGNVIAAPSIAMPTE